MSAITLHSVLLDLQLASCRNDEVPAGHRSFLREALGRGLVTLTDSPVAARWYLTEEGDRWLSRFVSLALDHGEVNLVVSALGLLLAEARRSPEYVGGPADVEALLSKVGDAVAERA